MAMYAVIKTGGKQYRVNTGDEIRVEPWRARAFPVVKDLVVDRSALDRIIAAGRM